MNTIGFDELKKVTLTEYSDDELIVIDDVRNFPKSELDGSVKLNMTLFAFAHKGKFQVSLDEQTVMVNEKELLICTPNTIINDYMISPDVELYICAFPVSRVDKLIFLGKRIWSNIEHIKRNPVIKMTDDDLALLLNYYNVAKINIRQPNKLYRHEILNILLTSFLFEIINITDRNVTENWQNNDFLRQGDKIFQRFVSLVSQHAGKIRSVTQYADMLHVSPKYLSMVVKKASGSSALDLIQKVAVKEISYNLKYSGKSIKEISNEMNFPNLSFFGKFVRRHTGMSPTELRKNAGKK